MLKLILIFIPLAGAYFGEPLKVQNIYIEETLEGPSCRLLKHRKKEREKVLRERVYLDDILPNSKIENLILKNQFLTNQYFLDPSEWQDPAIEVSLWAKVPPSLDATLKEVGLEKTFFSIRGVGLEWSSLANNFPDSLRILVKEDGVIHLKYLIYRADYCNNTDLSPQFSWLHPDENTIERFDSFEEIENYNIEIDL